MKRIVSLFVITVVFGALSGAAFGETAGNVAAGIAFVVFSLAFLIDLKDVNL